MVLPSRSFGFFPELTGLSYQDGGSERFVRPGAGQLLSLSPGESCYGDALEMTIRDREGRVTLSASVLASRLLISPSILPVLAISVTG